MRTLHSSYPLRVVSAILLDLQVRCVHRSVFFQLLPKRGVAVPHMRFNVNPFGSHARASQEQSAQLIEGSLIAAALLGGTTGGDRRDAQREGLGQDGRTRVNSEFL